MDSDSFEATKSHFTQGGNHSALCFRVKHLDVVGSFICSRKMRTRDNTNRQSGKLCSNQSSLHSAFPIELNVKAAALKEATLIPIGFSMTEKVNTPAVWSEWG
mmetsp:Transcript_82478/g.160866  ORF Transcript_82478/g.160866 Transcript_82478/m.160866 type:complete len:103 (-) Transcript_82478:177-485(-)